MSSRNQQRFIGALILLSVSFFALPWLFGSKKGSLPSVTPPPATVPAAPDTTNTPNQPTITFTSPSEIKPKPAGNPDAQNNSTSPSENKQDNSIVQQIENLAKNNLQNPQPPTKPEPTANTTIQTNTSKTTVENNANNLANTTPIVNASTPIKPVANTKENTTVNTKVEVSQTDKNTNTIKNTNIAKNTNTIKNTTTLPTEAIKSTPPEKIKVDANAKKPTATSTTNLTSSAKTNTKLQLPSIQLIEQPQDAENSKSPAHVTNNSTTQNAVKNKPSSNNTVANNNPTTQTAPVVNKQPTASAHAGGRWAVQVGVFSQKDNAQQLMQAYQKAQYPAYVEAVGSQYRVRLGPFKNNNDANKVRSTLNNAGKSASVVGLQ